MTVEEWAKKLDGREYGEETTKAENKQMADEGIIAVFGASDDLLEFRGAFYEEAGAGEGAEVRLGKTGEGKITMFSKGQLNELDEMEGMETFKEAFNSIIERMSIISAKWCPDNLETSWLIETEIPHKTFDVMEDGELYCRGIVFHVDNVPVI
jgi:hypothetical protein